MLDDPTGMSLHGAVDLSGLVRKNAAPSPGAPGGASSSETALVRDITEAQMADIVTLSQTVPVILEFYGQGHQPALGALVESFGGRLALATIDVATAPELVQGLQITGIPTVFAVIAGRPAPLFQGLPPEDDIRKVFTDVLSAAQQAGVTGRLDAEPQETTSDDPQEPQWLTAAHEALRANDFEAARAAYTAGLAGDPKNAEALSGLGRVDLLQRIHSSGKTPDAIRQDAADDPANQDAQFLVADLDVAGGHVEDALRRLLNLFADADDDDAKARIRGRLVELFDAVGPTHPAVISARQKLSSLLY